MSEAQGSPQPDLASAFPASDVVRSIAWAYPVEADRELFYLRPAWTATGTPTLEDVAAVVRWKAPRVESRFLNSDLNRASDVSSLVSRALAPFLTVAPRDLGFHQVPDALISLTKLDYVGVRIGSAILSVFRPSLFTVMDRRAWSALYAYGLLSRPTTATLSSPTGYVDYLRLCHRLSVARGVSLRNLDRFLWVLGGSGGTHETSIRDREAAVSHDRW